MTTSKSISLVKIPAGLREFARDLERGWPSQMSALRASGVPLNLPFDNVTSRTDAAATIPEDVSAEILKLAPTESAALTLFRSRPLSRAQQRIPVLATLPTAYFRNGDTGLMQTSEVGWENVFLNVEELDCIVPVPKNVVADMSVDIWGEAKPLIAEAIGRALDGAVFFSVNKPASWPTAIVAAAVAAGNVVARGTATDAKGGIAKDISDVMATVEDSGYDVTGHIGRRGIKGLLRGARDTTGQKLLDVSANEIEGAPLKFPMPGLWPTGVSAAELVSGDFTQGILGVRQDMEWEVWDQAVIQDDAGNIVYNLAQQKMVALAVTARFAFAVPNPVNREQEDDAQRYPFGVLRSPAS